MRIAGSRAWLVTDARMDRAQVKMGGLVGAKLLSHQCTVLTGHKTGRNRDTLGGCPSAWVGLLRTNAG